MAKLVIIYHETSIVISFPIASLGVSKKISKHLDGKFLWGGAFSKPKSGFA